MKLQLFVLCCVLQSICGSKENDYPKIGEFNLFRKFELNFFEGFMNWVFETTLNSIHQCQEFGLRVANLWWRRCTRCVRSIHGFGTKRRMA